jgi:glycosyltransferase involved in cell wall biosynthesis
MVSIVIPAYNEERLIALCLQSLAGQETQHKFEVIVVNNNSTDRTLEAVQRFRGQLPLKVINEPQKGRGAARRTGFGVAQGDIIFSTDADVCLPKDWIENLLIYFQDPEIMAVSGTCRINDCSPLVNRIFNAFQPLAMILYRLGIGHFWLTGSNFAIRKSVYLATKGFSPYLNASEDTQLSFEVKKLGIIKFVSNVPVLTSGRRFQDSFFRGMFEYIRSYLHAFILPQGSAYLSDKR